ncbi:MAG: PKD domain-containing protein [Gammaproteobacteria bacterium]|nr:PKD domain-containing protein [Gammaproteobacteria bacterium]
MDHNIKYGTLVGAALLSGSSALGAVSLSDELQPEELYDSDSFLSKLDISDESNGARHIGLRARTPRAGSGDPGMFGFSSDSYSITEGNATASIVVERSNCGSESPAVSVFYAGSNGTASANSSGSGDYVSVSGTLSWSSGSKGGDGDCDPKSFSVPINDDSTYEGDETVNLSLSSPSGGATLGRDAAVLHIIENDPIPTGILGFSEENYNQAENGGFASIQVNRDSCTDMSPPASVNYAVSNGSAAAGANGDYILASGTLSWDSGDCDPKSFNIPINDDSSYEGDETVYLSLSSPGGGATLGQSSSVLNIIENDPPPAGSLGFSQESYSISENDGSATIQVNRDSCISDSPSVSVNYDAAGNNSSATAGASGDGDYIAVSGTLSWDSGSKAGADCEPKSFSVPINDDLAYEENETVYLSLNSPGGGATLGQSSTVLNIIENDPPPAGNFGFSQESYSISENGGSATIQVNRDSCISNSPSVSVNYYDAAGGKSSSAVAGSSEDYMAVSGTLNWGIGDCSPKSFSVPINDDSSYEGDETVHLSLSDPTGGATLGQSGTVLNIIENDSPPAGVLGFSQTSHTKFENSGFASIQVNRASCISNSPSVSVNYAAGNGAVSGTLHWGASGDCGPKSFSVPINDDSIYEGDETVQLSLNNPTGGATLGQSGTVLNIIEDDPPPAGNFGFSQESYSISENGDSASIQVNRDFCISNSPSVSVHYDAAGKDSPATATAGASGDYMAVSGSLNWGASGDCGPKSFSVPINDDSTYEGDETVYLSLNNPSGGATLGQSGTVLNIIEDESPPAGALGFSQTSYNEPENGGFASIQVNRDSCMNKSPPVSVNYAAGNGSATAGASGTGDYAAVSGTLDWGASGDCGPKSFNVSIYDDSIHESDESIHLSLSSPNGGATLAQDAAVLTIIENDPLPNQPPVAVFTITPVRGQDPLLVTVNAEASHDPDGSIVTYTWEFNGQNIVAPAKVEGEVPAGEYTLALTVTDDRGATASAPAQIITVDPVNQPPAVSISSSVNEDGPPLTVNFSAQGTDPEGGVLTFAWNFGDGSAAGAGTTISHTFQQAGTYTVQVTVADAGGLTGIASADITVMPLTGPGSAILIAAGGAQPDNTLYDYSNRFTQRMYRLLKKRGFTDEAVYYMNPRAPDIERPLDGRLEEERLDYALFDPERELTEAFQRAAANLAPGQQFVFYLHGHARQDNFRIMPDYELSASRLRDLLATLPAGVQQIVILDSCYSGSFLDELAGVQERIVITSSDAENSAWNTEYASFTDKFLNQLRRGNTLHEAFLAAEEMIIEAPALFREQRPWLDDDSDGLYSTRDGTRAAQVHLGEEGISAAPPPTIDSVRERAVLLEEVTTTTLWVRTTPSQTPEQALVDSPLLQVRAVLVNPEFTGNDYQGEATQFGRVELELLYNGAKNRYEADYDNFCTAGIWQILYQAQDKDGVWSDIVNGEVQAAGATCSLVNVSMSLNQSRYTAGEPLRLDMNVGGNGETDMYIGIIFPEPEGIFITIAHPLNFSWPNAIQVYQAGVTINGARIYPIMDSPVPDGVTKGFYSVCGLLTNVGSEPSDTANWQDFDCPEFEIY